ncbi:hypothetical protein XELAEV_18043623mg [Xenopus laevis]|uniref:Uncharacterized protein n=1 Tax=Xenopus laevis TaxID=8355 RepID=A0A974H317_XENLA|nr:hypothetical protein XELAEV_18043623mg [Xenopus laevis]
MNPNVYVTGPLYCGGNEGHDGQTTDQWWSRQELWANNSFHYALPPTMQPGERVRGGCSLWVPGTPKC